MIIYKTTNLVTGLIYIGKAVCASKSYLGSGKLLRLSIKKHGESAFKRVTIDIANSHEELHEKERFWIAFYHSRDRNIGYNILEGGEGCPFKHTEEAKQKIAEANRGRKLSKETKRKIANSMKGKRNCLGKTWSLSEEAKQHMQKPKSEEHKRKISVAMLNRSS